jgi:prepilin-type N-terminal cleavage/methylation domain-containing protein/prepilin-type processing-associated H-X9-DG protein
MVALMQESAVRLRDTVGQASSLSEWDRRLAGPSRGQAGRPPHSDSRDGGPTPTAGTAAPSGTGARGFTLIELLVVIVIIAVLAALGTSAWQRSQRQSRSVACMQNLRQIGAGLAKYIGDHDGTFPELAMARMDKTQNVPVIDTELRSYVPNPRVFACPDDRKRLAETSGTSYLWNMRLNGQRLANLSVSFVKMDPIDDPSRIMVMGDKEGFHPSLESKMNVLYADGHASQELTFVDDAPAK